MPYAASLLCVSRTENFLSLEANQILEAAPGSGVFGNFKFETLLTSSFHVIDRSPSLWLLELHVKFRVPSNKNYLVSQKLFLYFSGTFLVYMHMVNEFIYI